MLTAPPETVMIWSLAPEVVVLTATAVFCVKLQKEMLQVNDAKLDISAAVAAAAAAADGGGGGGGGGGDGTYAKYPSNPVCEPPMLTAPPIDVAESYVEVREITAELLENADMVMLQEP